GNLGRTRRAFHRSWLPESTTTFDAGRDGEGGIIAAPSRDGYSGWASRTSTIIGRRCRVIPTFQRYPTAARASRPPPRRAAMEFDPPGGGLGWRSKIKKPFAAHNRVTRFHEMPVLPRR